MTKLDSSNKFIVGTIGDDISIVRPVPLRMSKADALNLAVYLAVLADDVPARGEPSSFEQLKTIVENT